MERTWAAVVVGGRRDGGGAALERVPPRPTRPPACPPLRILLPASRTAGRRPAGTAGGAGGQVWPAAGRLAQPAVRPAHARRRHPRHPSEGPAPLWDVQCRPPDQQRSAGEAPWRLALPLPTVAGSAAGCRGQRLAHQPAPPPFVPPKHPWQSWNESVAMWEAHRDNGSGYECSHYCHPSAPQARQADGMGGWRRGGEGERAGPQAPPTLATTSRVDARVLCLAALVAADQASPCRPAAPPSRSPGSWPCTARWSSSHVSSHVSSSSSSSSSSRSKRSRWSRRRAIDPPPADLLAAPSSHWSSLILS